MSKTIRNVVKWTKSQRGGKKGTERLTSAAKEVPKLLERETKAYELFGQKPIVVSEYPHLPRNKKFHPRLGDIVSVSSEYWRFQTRFMVTDINRREIELKEVIYEKPPFVREPSSGIRVYKKRDSYRFVETENGKMLYFDSVGSVPASRRRFFHWTRY